MNALRREVGATRRTPALEPALRHVDLWAAGPRYGPGRLPFPVPSATFLRVEPFVRGPLLDSYRGRSRLSFAYAAGSLVEGLTEEADLDLTLVWRSEPPPAEERVPIELADPSPAPATFDKLNFSLDRFWAMGQQIDVKHVALTEFEHWVHEVEAGHGTSGYPMPVIVMHALTTGVVLADVDGAAGSLIARLRPVPAEFIASTARVARGGRASYVEELTRCVVRGDGLLFHELAAQAARTAYIAWFARRGMYWPHEKRLGTRLQALGESELAQLDATLWTDGTLNDKLGRITQLLERLDD